MSAFLGNKRFDAEKFQVTAVSRVTGKLEEIDKNAKQLITDITGDGAPVDFDRSNQISNSIENRLFYTDGSDMLANRGFTVSLMHVPTSNEVYFKAFIRSFNETYSSDWASDSVFGRTDQIHMFKATSRSITMSIIVPAASISEGFENLSKVQTLTDFLYPVYDTQEGDTPNALTMTQSPLLRLRFANLVTTNGPTESWHPDAKKFKELAKAPFGSDSKDGVLGIMTNLTIAHNIENSEMGVFMLSDGVVIQRGIELTFDFKVLHEQTRGYIGNDKIGGHVYNVNAEVTDGFKTREARALAYLQGRVEQLAEDAAAEEAQELSDQARANAIAQGLVNEDGTINNKRRKRIGNRLRRTTEGNTFLSALNPFDARPYRDADRATAAASAYASMEGGGSMATTDDVDSWAAQAGVDSDNLNFFGFIK